MSRKAKRGAIESDPWLFPPPPPGSQGSAEPAGRRLKYPIWTENKAKLIERYLYFFVLITKHGTYLDLFAGPQKAGSPGMWAAELVLQNRPRWLRHFHLFEKTRTGVRQLERLKASQPPRVTKGPKKEPLRDITIHPGDSNVMVKRVLERNPIPSREATFCLLDQRTFECHWSTVEYLAAHKKGGNKIELFYFLANGWLGRAFKGQKNKEALTAWWGRPDWSALRTMRPDERANAFAKRLREDLGYRSVKAYPIRQRKGGGRIMYYMIHAADHEESPKQMYRAYHRAVTAKEPIQQLLAAFADK